MRVVYYKGEDTIEAIDAYHVTVKFTPIKGGTKVKIIFDTEAGAKKFEYTLPIDKATATKKVLEALSADVILSTNTFIQPL